MTVITAVQCHRLLVVVPCRCRGFVSARKASRPIPATCRNNVLDAGETCLNCAEGGVSCVACGGPCDACLSCSNCKRDRKETDVDCGGIDCAKRCANNKACKVPSDCAGGACLWVNPQDRRVDGPRACKTRTCSDQQQNGGEVLYDAPMCVLQCHEGRAHSHSHSHTHTHTHTHTLTHTHSHTHRDTHSHSHTHSHTYSYSHSHSHTLTHSTQANTRMVALPRRRKHAVPLSQGSES
jgi:hypothetical protein